MSFSSSAGMTKVKVGKEDQSSNEFVEKRRSALERYDKKKLRNTSVCILTNQACFRLISFQPAHVFYISLVQTNNPAQSAWSYLVFMYLFCHCYVISHSDITVSRSSSQIHPLWCIQGHSDIWEYLSDIEKLFFLSALTMYACVSVRHG